MENSVKEADKLFKEGKEKITTGLMRWSKDYTGAVMSFDEAIKLYKQAKAWPKAIEALKKAMICNEKLNDSWGVARNLEAIVNIMIENLSPSEFNADELNGVLQQANVAFKMAESNNNAIKLYSKVSKF